MLKLRPFSNKKVLLHERKSDTACRVASACYAGLSNGEVPHPVMVGGTLSSHGGEYPIQAWWGGTQSTPHHPDLAEGGGTPGTPHHPDLWGIPRVPPFQNWDGVPPFRPGMGYPPPRPLMGYPPVNVWTDTQSENITFPHPLDVGSNYLFELETDPVQLRK